MTTQPQTPPQTPTLWSNIHDATGLVLSVGTNWIAEWIRDLGYNEQESVEANMQRLTQGIQAVVVSLDSPQGEQLKRELSALLADAVEIMKPSAEKATDVAIEGMEKISKTGVRIVNTALNELPPVFLLNELSNVGTAMAQAGETAAKLSTTGMEAWNKLDAQKQKAQSLFAQARALLSQTVASVNQGVASTLAGAQQATNHYGQQVLSEQTINHMTGGAATKHRKKQKQHLTRRIQASYAQFLGGGGLSKRYSSAKKSRRKKKSTPPKPLAFLDTFVMSNHFRDLYG